MPYGHTPPVQDRSKNAAVTPLLYMVLGGGGGGIGGEGVGWVWGGLIKTSAGGSLDTGAGWTNKSPGIQTSGQSEAEESVCTHDRQCVYNEPLH